MVDRIIKFFSSLRLTVVLLSAGLLLVFVGTLAQVNEGLYQAQVRYFKSWFIWQPTIGDSQWPIMLPGGYLIGTLLLINLVTAHIRRFQFTRKKLGIHLIHGGLILLLLGQLLTDVLSRESAMTLSEGQSKNYSEAFHDNELALIDTSGAQANHVVSIPETLLAAKGEIRDPAMPFGLRVRDYWPNCEIQEQPPAEARAVAADHGNLTNMMLLPLPAADPAAEKTKAAVLVEVLSDTNSLGTFLVQAHAQAEEQETFKYAGREWALGVLYAPMMGGNQLMVSDAADTAGNSAVFFPESDFKSELHRDGLPVKLRVKEYWPNCRLYSRPGSTAIQPRVTQGVLAGDLVTPTALVTDTDHRNVPAAVVEAFNDQGPLGTWLLWTAYSAPDMLMLGNKAYQLSFRFKRYYAPYSIGLVKFNHDIYAGTPIPKNFSSRLHVVNPARNEDREVLIKMNNPLRYSGTTYYQGGFSERDPHVSILQVVTNPSWLTPYLACLLVGGGLIVQFMSHLLGFAMKRRTA